MLNPQLRLVCNDTDCVTYKNKSRSRFLVVRCTQMYLFQKKRGKDDYKVTVRLLVKSL